MKTWDIVSMPRSPGLAPSDLYLFPTVKERLEYSDVTDEDQLFEELQTILRSVPGENLERVFEAWRGRFQNVNQGDGSHID
jgi:hypothetical protein